MENHQQVIPASKDLKAKRQRLSRRPPVSFLKAKRQTEAIWDRANSTSIRDLENHY